MRVAADSNALVRFLVGDHELQSARAKAVLDAADVVYLDTVVLCETVWVLRRAYRLTPVRIAAALSELLDSDKIEADRLAAEAGLAMLRAGGDFADGVILHRSGQAQCQSLITFDRRFAQQAGGGRVMLLGAT